MTTITRSFNKIEKHFEEPDKTFFYKDKKMNNTISFNVPAGSQISKISFSELSVAEAENMPGSFMSEILEIQNETCEDEKPDLEAAQKPKRPAPREIFVMIELEPEKNRQQPVCSDDECRQKGTEFVNEDGILIWYCKDHYFTVKSKQIADRKS